MRTALVLLLLCLCDGMQSTCQTDCLSCSSIIPKQLSFNAVVCLIECEGNVSPAFTWDLCRQALPSLGSPVSLGGAIWKRSQEEVEAQFPDEEEQAEGGLLLPVALQRFDHVTRALGVDKDLGSKVNQMNTAYNSQNSLSLEDEYNEEEGKDEGQGDTELSLSKRFGGFYRGRHGYKKLISPGRSYQKRYGGFIGIRKSARKWNNQKRFSEFLKQYLGMSTRATEFSSMAEDVGQQNEV
ncbi:prepronociceptin [Thalassophryne amazonica]|uniref:prepronociceptin n=1 Tax=Thalassophryne amazonica TaxID=390379 RepID=UPI0014722A91|nr:prepronociceptin [Thalassophryne amazonica]